MPTIHLKNNQVEYYFSFKQKYLFIRGNSGIGKTSLISLIADYNLNPSAVDCLGDTNVRVLQSSSDLSLENQIFFLDENHPLLYKGDFSTLFNNSNNYFVIINRSRNLNSLKTGLDSLVNMEIDSNGVHIVREIYPRREHLDVIGECIVCEDAKSGKQFIESMLARSIESTESSTRFGVKLRKLQKHSYTLIYDRCGISFSYEDMLLIVKKYEMEIVSEVDWDSFESYILESSIYGCEVPWFPDKEQNATKMFKELIDDRYDKSFIPAHMQLPIYWKVAELKELSDTTVPDSSIKPMDVL